MRIRHCGWPAVPFAYGKVARGSQDPWWGVRNTLTAILIDFHCHPQTVSEPAKTITLSILLHFSCVPGTTVPTRVAVGPHLLWIRVSMMATATHLLWSSWLRADRAAIVLCHHGAVITPVTAWQSSILQTAALYFLRSSQPSLPTLVLVFHGLSTGP